jgi:hypothetical protein
MIFHYSNCTPIIPAAQVGNSKRAMSAYFQGRQEVLNKLLLKDPDTFVFRLVGASKVQRANGPGT